MVRVLFMCTLLLLSTGLQAEQQSVSQALKTLQAVGPKGAGNEKAQAAWQFLSKQPAEQLPTILAGLDKAGPLAANWIIALGDQIVDQTLDADKPLPAKELEAFLMDTSHNPLARRRAYEWIVKVDPEAEERIIPKMLNDPSNEMRRDAVARLQSQAEELLKQKSKEQATALLQKAFTASRDTDQVEELAKELDKLGVKVNLPKHFGFIMDWHLIAPFDNTDKKGFPVAYPPEKEIDLDAEYQGKTGAVRWINHITNEDYGLVDLNEALDRHKGAIAYAYTVFTSEKEQEVELRLGSVTAWKLWVNGELVFQREEYHRGIRMDQYRMTTKLKKGDNTILMKICQNEQEEQWAQRWQFQLRVCDPVGTAILSTTRPEPKQD